MDRRLRRSTGWSRGQAIDHLVERAGVERGFIHAAVRRCTSDPGQTLACMVSQLKIIERRARARARP